MTTDDTGAGEGLPAYNKDVMCPKCGYRCASTMHRHSGDSGGYGSPGWADFKVREQERLDRFCINCSYQWAENIIGATP